uniref:DUF4776 domain-containing protein n=1 Tax=Anopheles maculatus TaxID=74869 RepID=A0A182SRX0_9DIPT
MVFSVEPSETFWDTPGQPYQDESVATAESYSLMFFIKLLELPGRNEDEVYTVSLHCVGGGDSVTGTLAVLNAKKPGDVVSLQADKDKFVRFLKENSINVRIKPTDSNVCKGVLKLNGSKVMEFEPGVENSTPVEEQIPIHDDANEVVGMITMVLQVVHNAKKVIDSLPNADIMYSINDNKLKSADKQDAELRQLLVCTECSMPRTSNNGSGCEYEIIDGILHRKGVSSTERIIEQIKEKINRAKLDETFGHRDSMSSNVNDASRKFCAECGGMTITGETCKAGVVRASRTRSSQKIPEPRYSGYPAKNASKNSIRCCERCKACLDWLPSECCCPKCGYKPSKENTPIKPVLPPYFDNTPELGPLPTGKAASLRGSDTIVGSSQSCQLCHICQTRCIDCANQISQQGASKTSSSFICAPVQSKPAIDSTPSRPITRRPWRTARPSHGPKTAPVKLQGSAKGKRTDEMKQVYGAKVGKECKNQPQTTTNDKGRISAGQIRKSYNANIRQIKRQNRKLYSYRFGKRHPGIVVGHRTCMRQDPLVPPHMGWQWDICPPGIDKRRPGWRPGAVRQPIKQLMQHFLKCYPLDNVPVSKKKTVGFHSEDPSQGGDTKQKPTLHITKQNGVYSITMNPLKDSDTLKTTDDPYLPCKPIKFKLAKDPHRTKLYQLRDVLKRKGLPLCGCKELANCEHCTDREKRLLAEEIRRSAKVLGLSAKTTICDVPSGSESELDVEFTPPSAIIRPDAHRPDVVVAETQYNVQDFQLKPVSDGKDIKPKASTRGGASNQGKGDALGSKTRTGLTCRGPPKDSKDDQGRAVVVLLLVKVRATAPTSAPPTVRTPATATAPRFTFSSGVPCQRRCQTG